MHPGGLVKSGTRVHKAIEEGNSLKFAKSLGIPVPQVHEVSNNGTGGWILMDFVDGDCLEDVWSSMAAEEKKSIARQLREIISTMRAAGKTQRTIGAIGGPARDLRQDFDYEGGDFETEAEFNEFVLDLLKGTPPLIRSAIAGSLETGHAMVFSHGDLTPSNIIVKDGRIAGLIDWEYSGWYPEYWEFVKFFDRETDCEDWKQYAEEIFETLYPKHLITFQVLARWQRP